MTSRRTFLRYSSATATLAAVAPLHRACAEVNSYSIPKYAKPTESLSASDWLKQATANANLEATSRSLRGKLVFGRFMDEMYYLTLPISWEPNPGQEKYKKVVAPVGFVTDLASIPRPFYSVLRPDGPYVYPAILHDYLYWQQKGAKDDADSVLKFGMQDLRIPTPIIDIIYEGVHLGGQLAWDNNAKLKGQGEKRILKIDLIPDDPSITWAEWKKDPSHFW